MPLMKEWIQQLILAPILQTLNMHNRCMSYRFLLLNKSIHTAVLL